MSLSVGWTSNGELDYKRLTLMGDNGYRCPIAKEFIRRGHRIKWLGVKPHLASDPEILKGVDDYYWLWRMRPGYPGHSASDYFAHILSTYEDKIGQYLPKLDILIYEPRNFCVDQIAHQALLLHHYCQQPDTVVMIWDADAVFMNDAAASFVSGKDQHLRRVFNECKDRVVLMYPSFDIPDECKNIYTYTVPMFVFFQPIHHTFDVWPNPEPKYDISYIGNDYDRKGMFERFFSKATPLSKEERRARMAFNRKLTETEQSNRKLLYDMEDLPYNLELFGNWNEEYIKEPQFANVNWHGPIDQTQVSLVYYNTLCTLNINRPFYSKTGFTVDRMSEVLQSGSILLLNDDYHGGEYVVSGKEFLVHDRKDLAEKIRWLRSLTVEQRAEIIAKQLSVFKKYDEVTRVDMMMNYYLKFKDVLNKSPYNLSDFRMKGVEWNVSVEAAQKKADEFSVKKAITVDRQKSALRGEIK